MVPLDAWLRSVLWDSHLPLPPEASDGRLPSAKDSPPSEFEIHRTKGLLHLSDGSRKVIQGVREIFEIRDLPVEEESDSSGGNAMGKIVLIGRGLDLQLFEMSLRSVFSDEMV